MRNLKQERRWCVFSQNKIPCVDVYTGGKSNEPESWISYEDATRLTQVYSALFSWKGFFISRREDNPAFALCVIDVDAHEQEVNPLAERILDLFKGTYIERSPSGKGYHIICNFELSKNPVDETGNRTYKIYNRQLELELYIGGTTNKALTYTGDVCSETEEITDQTEQVLEFIRMYMLDYETVRTKQRREEKKYEILPEDENYITERLNIARRSQYGEIFRKLYDEGDISDFGNDHSRADMYLAKRLCFWLGPYEELIDEAFRASRLYRDKWDERRGAETYGDRTIRIAVDNSDKCYEPPENTQIYPNWDGILPGESADTSPETPDTTVEQTSVTPEDVLKLINEAPDDNRISVFNLPCGTGKSSAIRLKMRQVRSEGVLQHRETLGNIMACDKKCDTKTAV